MKTILDKLEAGHVEVSPALTERLRQLKRHLRCLESEPLTRVNAAARKNVREEVRDIEAAIRGVERSAGAVSR